MTVYSRAPLRLSFAGGGTDVEPYVSDYGGYILSAAIKLYSRAIYGLQHTPENEIEKLLSEISGKDLKILTDVHEASGLGGSSTCFVAGLKAAYPELQREQIARLAFYLERNVMKIPGGLQDQYCATYGGMLFMTIEGRTVYLDEMELPETVARLLLLVYTGARKVSGDRIIEDQAAYYNVKALHHQKQIAREMRDSLLALDLITFGQHLAASWEAKCEASSLVSTSEIEELYSYCQSNGAIGGCLMGAGAGGYMLIMEHPDSEGMVRQALVRKDIAYTNIELDVEGAKITRGGDS